MSSEVSSHEGVPPAHQHKEEETITTRSGKRAAVLSALQAAEHPLTVPEIAEAAKCSRITVRRHLARLGNEGRVCLAGQRPRLDTDGRRLPSRRKNTYRADA